MPGISPLALAAMLVTGTLMLALSIVCGCSLWQVLSESYVPAGDDRPSAPRRPR